MKEKMINIGKYTTIRVGTLRVRVEITDYKYTYGRDRWYVKPVAGEGEMWVEKIGAISEG